MRIMKILKKLKMKMDLMKKPSIQNIIEVETQMTI